MGIAILSGILDSIAALSGPKPLQTDPNSPVEDVPPRLPSRFIACVRRPDSAKRVKKHLWEHSSCVKVVQNDNVPAVAR
jgi:pyrroline-5-carboxylate reductase